MELLTRLGALACNFPGAAGGGMRLLQRNYKYVVSHSRDSEFTVVVGLVFQARGTP